MNTNDTSSHISTSPGAIPDVSTNTSSLIPSATSVSDSGHSYKNAVREYLGKGLRYVVPLVISVCLLIWLFHKVNFHDVVTTVKDGCNFCWIAVMMLLTMLSRMIRGVRWGLQLRAAGVKRMPVVCEWVTIWGAYALNIVFPQLGEAWRCVFVSRREKTQLSTVIGTDVGDRGSDLVVILVLLGVSLVVAHPFISDFINRYSLGRDMRDITDDPVVWIGLGIVVGGLWAILHFCKTMIWVKRLDTNLDRIWDGFKVIFTMKKWWLYLLLTIAIWVCYFLQTYVVFFAFPFTHKLITDPHMAYGLIPGLVVFVFGSMSMAIPSNGGLGPWNLAIMFALSLFGISNTEGTAFSIVMWSCQAIMIIALGVFSAIYVSTTSGKGGDTTQNTSTSAAKA